MECANCEMRGAEVVACMSERVAEQLAREGCSEMRSDTHSIVAAPRITQFARSMRRPPYGGRHMERVRCDMGGP
eukprot:929174-Lingulodinium_polyedra.AAC.1